ncbi:Hypothetical protein A7982_00741 [Minicystis rosea]|nr:Hypothetical protein A7982_00741 [Minicystis rosea]
MWRLVASILIALFVTLPVAGAAVSAAIDEATGKGLPHDPTMWPTIIGMAVIIVSSSWGSRRLFTTWRATRPPRVDGPGLLEACALHRPGLFERAMSFNGFGLRYLDPHGRRPDGSVIATMWLTAAFFPIAPIRRERVHVLAREKQGGIPFVVSWESASLRSLECLPVDRKRNRGVYLSYYALFLPLLVAPLVAGFVYLVNVDFDVSATAFWCGALLTMVWGIGVVAYQWRTMELRSP